MRSEERSSERLLLPGLRPQRRDLPRLFAENREYPFGDDGKGVERAGEAPMVVRLEEVPLQVFGGTREMRAQVEDGGVRHVRQELIGGFEVSSFGK